MAAVAAIEKRLDYPRGRVGDYDGVAQTKYWDCGPATAQIILAAAGIHKTEDWLINWVNARVAAGDRIGTNGTNHAGLLCPLLNELLPGSGYTAVWLSRQPVTQAQIEQLWKDVVRSVDAGRGVVLNFESPPNYRPRGTNGSVSPAYTGNNTIYHYVAGMGYATDSAGRRHIWIADPGFSPFGYWCGLEQVAALIVPHAYSFAATAPILAEKKKEEPPAPTPPAPVEVLAVIKQADWDAVWRTNTEWMAREFSDQKAVAAIVASAQSGDLRGRQALANLEAANPAALEQFIATQKGAA